MELIELKGTEKQVNWAKAIRKDRLKVWQGADSAGFQEVESMLTQQKMASWWITSKDKSLREICRQLQSGAGPKAPGKQAVPVVPPKVAMKTVDEVWETVVTGTGFRRSGPAVDMTTGEVVNDATLPF